jgi:hypothetical protein
MSALNFLHVDFTRSLLSGSMRGCQQVTRQARAAAGLLAILSQVLPEHAQDGPSRVPLLCLASSQFGARCERRPRCTILRLLLARDVERARRECEFNTLSSKLRHQL